MRSGFLGIIAGGFLALEIVGIVLVAGKIGVLATFAWLLAGVLLGGWLIRSAGTGFMPELIQATSGGRDPFSVMWRTGRRFLAGVLLIFPGPFSDVLALLLLLTAGLPRNTDTGYMCRRHGGPYADMGHGYQGTRRAGGGADDGVIEGEFRRED